MPDWNRGTTIPDHATENRTGGGHLWIWGSVYLSATPWMSQISSLPPEWQYVKWLGPPGGSGGGVPTEVCLPTAERTNRFLAAFESPSVAVRASRRGCMCNWWDFHAVPQPHREVITTNSEVENFANLNCRV